MALWSKIRFVGASVLALVVLAGCGRVADSGAILQRGYALNSTMVEVDNRRVPCIVARGSSDTGGLAVSCDWEGAAVIP